MIFKYYLPSGLQKASLAVGKSIVWPGFNISTPGKNLRLFGFGVSWVWMNIFLNNGVCNFARFILEPLLDKE